MIKKWIAEHTELLTWMFIIGVMGCIGGVVYINKPWSLEKKCGDPAKWSDYSSFNPVMGISELEHSVRKREYEELYQKCQQLWQRQRH